MSKSTGSKGSGSSQGGTNNSKGSNTSSSSSSDSEGSSSSSSNASKGGGNSGASQAASNAAKSAAESAAKTDAANKAASESASKAQSDADAQSSQQQSQHEAAVASGQEQAKASAETYGSFIQGVLDAAPVGVDNLNKGRFGTELSDAEIANTLSEADHAFAANQAWNAGEYGNWAANKIGGMVDAVQGWGYAQTRELTQAPLDKVADIARNPAVKGLAVMTGGLPGLALTAGVGLVDSVADYAQDEKTGKQSAFQGIGDLVTSFGPPGVQMAYRAVTSPKDAARQGIGMMTQTGNPIADTVLSRSFGFMSDNMIDGLSNPMEGPRDTGLTNSALGEGLLASRSNADNAYRTKVTQTTGSYTAPKVMSDDALLLEWQKLGQQELNKPRYSSSLLFGLS